MIPRIFKYQLVDFIISFLRNSWKRRPGRLSKQLSIKVETVDKEKLWEFDQLDYKKLGIFVSKCVAFHRLGLNNLFIIYNFIQVNWLRDFPRTWKMVINYPG